MEQMIRRVFPAVIADAFTATMENVVVAEDMIKAKKLKHPDKAGDLDKAFPSLCTPELLQNKHPRLYDHHVNELLDRVVDGATGLEFSYGTKAEALCVLLNTSLKSPLKQDYLALADKLFVEIFGGLPDGVEGVTPESYTGAADEILSNICRGTLRNMSRRLK